MSTRFRTWFLVGVILGVILAAVTAAQAPPQSAPPPSPPPSSAPPGATPPGAATAASEAPPALSELDRLRVINALQAVELAAVRLQAARAEADKLISGLQVPGWILTEKLEYVKAPKDK